MWKKKLAAAALGFVLAMPIPAWASVQKDGVHITILHTNDMHSRVLTTDDSSKSVGMGWLAGAMKAQRQTEPDTLVLDAGDTFHGMPIVNLSRGENMVLLMNLAGYDATTPGNHDFNYGADRLRELAGMLEFPMLSANVLDKNSQRTIFKPYTSYEFNGVKVAVLGLTTPEAAYKTNPEGVKNVEFADPIVIAKKYMPEIRKNHDVVIGLMHMGIDMSSVVKSTDIAKAVPGFDVIIDGHSHSYLPKGIKAGRTLVCQTGYYDHDLGKVELVVKKHKVKKAKATLLDKEAVEALAGKPDEKVVQALTEIEKENKKKLDRVVGESPRALTGERDMVRAHETELGNLTADAMRAAAGSEIAMANGGGIRTGLPQGQVTFGDVISIFPFGNTIKVVELSGSDLKAALEHAVEYVPENFGSFMNVSGLTFTMDSKAPAGSRVSDVKVAGVPLDENSNYTVALNDFNAAGGDDFPMFKAAKVVGERGTMEEAFVNYLQSNGLKGIETGRITVK